AIPQDGSYTVSVKFASVSGAATNAPFTVKHDSGSTTVPVDESTSAGSWVSLGMFAFTASNTNQSITLSDAANGTVVADAVKLVRDNSADTDNEKKDFTYLYDPNGN